MEGVNTFSTIRPVSKIVPVITLWFRVDFGITKFINIKKWMFVNSTSHFRYIIHPALKFLNIHEPHCCRLTLMISHQHYVTHAFVAKFRYISSCVNDLIVPIKFVVFAIESQISGWFSRSLTNAHALEL